MGFIITLQNFIIIMSISACVGAIIGWIKARETLDYFK